MVMSVLHAIFLSDEVEGDGLVLSGIDNSFLMSPGLRLLAVVELTNKVDSLLSIAFSETKKNPLIHSFQLSTRLRVHEG